MNIDPNHTHKASDLPAIIQLKDQRIATLEGEVNLLKEQLSWLKKQIFGQKSERIVADLHIQPLLPEIGAVEPQATEPEIEKISYDRAKRPRKTGFDTISFPDDLPVKRVELDIPESEKICPESGEPLVCIGHDVSRKLGRSPEQFFIVEQVPGQARYCRDPAVTLA